MQATLTAVSGVFLLLSSGALVIKSEKARPEHAPPGVPAAGYGEALRWGVDSLRARPSDWEKTLRLGWGQAPEAMDEYMDRAAPIVGALREASSGLPGDFAEADPRVLWSLGGLLGLEAQRLASAGNTAEALEVIGSGYRVAEHVRDSLGLTSIAHFQSVPIELDLHTALESILTRESLTESALLPLLATMGEIRDRRPGVRSLLEVDGENLEQFLRNSQGGTSPGEGADLERVQGLFDSGYSAMLDALEAGMQAGNWTAYRSRFEALESRLEALEPPTNAVERTAAKKMRLEITADIALLLAIEGADRNADTTLWYDARFDLIRVGLALRAFEVRHGKFPQVLGALVPDFLAEVPKDPFAPAQTGETFIWEPNHGPARLYSVGTDRVSSGGAKRALHPGDAGDLILTL